MHTRAFIIFSALLLAAVPRSFGSPLTNSNSVVVGSSQGNYVIDDKHKLAVGDKLSFRILQDDDDAKSLVVTDSGELETPYLGRVAAEGKTCRQLAAEIKTALDKDYYYDATVVIAVDQMAKTLGKIYINGPVRTPGPQEIPSDEVLTLAKAIARAGGFDDYADRKHVRVTRKSKTPGGPDEVIVRDEALVIEKGLMESDLPLKPGDFIYVPEKLVRF